MALIFKRVRQGGDISADSTDGKCRYTIGRHCVRWLWRIVVVDWRSELGYQRCFSLVFRTLAECYEYAGRHDQCPELPSIERYVPIIATHDGRPVYRVSFAEVRPLADAWVVQPELEILHNCTDWQPGDMRATWVTNQHHAFPRWLVWSEGTWWRIAMHWRNMDAMKHATALIKQHNGTAVTYVRGLLQATDNYRPFPERCPDPDVPAQRVSVAQIPTDHCVLCS